MKLNQLFTQYQDGGQFGATWSLEFEGPFEATLASAACNPGLQAAGRVTGKASHEMAKAAAIAAADHALAAWKTWITLVIQARGDGPFVRRPGELGYEAAARELRAAGVL